MTKTTWYDNMTEEQKAALDREFNDRWKKLNRKYQRDWYARKSAEEKKAYNKHRYQKYEKSTTRGKDKQANSHSEKYLATRAWLAKKYPQYFKED